METVINNIDAFWAVSTCKYAPPREWHSSGSCRGTWGNGSDIKIVVKNGQIIPLGSVATTDSDVAFIQCNSVSWGGSSNLQHVASSRLAKQRGLGSLDPVLAKRSSQVE